MENSTTNTTASTPPRTTSLIFPQCTPLGLSMVDFPVPATLATTGEYLRGFVLVGGRWDLSLSCLELYVAKENGQPDGDWLSIHHRDYALLKCGDEETMMRYLHRGTAIAPDLPMSHYFSLPLPTMCAHVLVKVTPKQPSLKRQKTMATLGITPTPNAMSDFWSNYPLESAGDVSQTEFDLDKLSDKVGTVVETPGLHAFWKDYGGFPAQYLVRKEDAQVWQVIKDTLQTEYKVVLLGSPGVGKSTLLALVTFYVAFVLRKKVLVVRQLVVADAYNAVVYLTPLGEMYRAVNIADPSDFVRGQPLDTFVFIDGYSQDEVKATSLMAHSLFAASGPYDRKSNDFARLILLSAWKPKGLLLYAKRTNWVVDVGLRETTSN